MDRSLKDLDEEDLESRDRMPSLIPGEWIWDDRIKGLVFYSYTEKEKPLFTSVPASVSAPPRVQKDSIFKEVFHTAAVAKFTKYFERKVKPDDPNVVILQDCKDVVLYSTDVKLLNLEFIKLFHTKNVDIFLRSLIVYFQFYLQVWNKLQYRRAEAARKLRQPSVDIWEDNLRDDLADLRCVVARNYACLLTGIGEFRKYHHMKGENNMSLSEKDRRRFELLFKVSVRVIWVALQRKNLTLIEKEFDKLTRTIHFSPSEHDEFKRGSYVALPDEEKILRGKAFTEEDKLLHRSPCIQELTNGDHDYRLLSIGVTDIEDRIDRITFLEIAYTAPEELLEELFVGVGILGVPKKFLDPLLNEDFQSTKKRSSVMKPIPSFAIPPGKPYDLTKIHERLHIVPCRYKESATATNARRDQCKMWLDYLNKDGQFRRSSAFKEVPIEYK
ncbi:unnamed protein product [Phyllotreta striolata]|uniref:Uncharacterized protein n=1 Tax=Phyllotreta striolata TaxID=444603 RepID=A0A9N9TEB2_PHYSR|nr:unnamed protein product [Phyllotreta striolata]